MFSSLKLNSLKCQSNSASETKKDKNDENDNNDGDVSDHMYEVLPNYDSKTCKCHSNYVSRSPKSLKTSLSKRMSKWRMECPGITNLRISRTDEDLDVKNSPTDKKDLSSITHAVNLKTKVTTVSIEREDGNLGITLRGGFQQSPDISKPVTITYIRPDGPAAREGTIKCGDRLLAVDGISLQTKSLSEAQTLLRQPTKSTLLTIEYDVNVLDAVEHANGPLLIEMELKSFEELGASLGQNENGIIVDNIKPGSLADRCGALHVGDEILAVNSIRIDCTALVVEDVVKFIDCNCPMLRLEILPSYANLNYSDIGTWRSKDNILSPGSTLSGISTLKSQGGRRNLDCTAIDDPHEMENFYTLKSTAAGSTGFHCSNMALTHSETVHTTIYRENGIFGIECIDSPDGGAVIISSVIHGSPAERSQCLYPGDRILSINNKNLALENLNAKTINEILEGKTDNVPCMKLNLHTKFDVLDTVVPTSGIFTVKLAKRGSSGLGITITASKTSGFMVCEMKKGSIAYRAGSLLPGDRILAINNIPLNQCSVEFVAHILHQSSNIVTLSVQRKDVADMSNCRKVIYTVELQRYGGPLGMTIAGSEEPFHPITISGLSSGGLGEQTGVLHVGDEILAINNHNLHGEPLSKAHQLLQNSPDLVTLKISRSIAPHSRFSNNISPFLPPSVDSAVESWTSSRVDLTSSPDYHKTLMRDSRDYSKRKVKVKQLWPPLTGDYSNASDMDLAKTLVDGEIPDFSLLDEITSENLKIKKELDLLSLRLDAKCKISEINSDNILENTNSEEDDSQNKFDSEAMAQSRENDHIVNGNPDTDLSRLNHTDTIREHKLFSNGNKDYTSESFPNDFENLDMSYLPESRSWFRSQCLGTESSMESIKNEFQNSQLYRVTLHKDPIYEDFGFSVSDGLYERGVFINRIRKGGPADLDNVLKPYDRILQVNDTYTQDFDCCLTVPLIASAGDSITILVARNCRNSKSENISESEKVFNHGCDSSASLTCLENDLDGSQRILV